MTNDTYMCVDNDVKLNPGRMLVFILTASAVEWVLLWWML